MSVTNDEVKNSSYIDTHAGSRRCVDEEGEGGGEGAGEGK